jgi:hypothetical protein
MILSVQKCNIMLIYPTDDMKSMVKLMVVYVATIYVMVVGQVWWFGVMDLLFSIILSLQKCNMMLIYPTDHIESMTALMVECVGYIVCGGRWADLVVWGYGLTVPTRNRKIVQSL